jgi:hypothetical protein
MGSMENYVCLYIMRALSLDYILSNTCIVVSQHDVVKHMMHKPILGGMIGKWAYSSVEYNFRYEPLRAMKGQTLADFIADHMIAKDKAACLVETVSWRLCFDGSVCKRGQGQDVL